MDKTEIQSEIEILLAKTGKLIQAVNDLDVETALRKAHEGLLAASLHLQFRLPEKTLPKLIRRNLF